MTTKLAFLSLFLIFPSFCTDKQEEKDTPHPTTHQRALSNETLQQWEEKMEQFSNKSAKPKTLRSKLFCAPIYTEKQSEKKPRKKKLVTTIFGPTIINTLRSINPCSKPPGSLNKAIENSLTVISDVETKELMWVDPYNLLCDDRKDRIEKFMKQSDTKRSNQIFDSISDFRPYLRDESRPFEEYLVLQMCEHVAVTKRDGRKRTPLMLASSYDNVKGVSKLIQRGANLESADEDGETALFTSTRIGSVACCKALLEGGFSSSKILQKGANVNAESKTGYTCLMLAAEFGYVNLVSLFLKSGADTRIENSSGRTAAEIAKPHCVDVIEAFDTFAKFMNGKQPKNAQKTILKKLLHLYSLPSDNKEKN